MNFRSISSVRLTVSVITFPTGVSFRRTDRDNDLLGAASEPNPNHCWATALAGIRIMPNVNYKPRPHPPFPREREGSAVR